MKKTIKCFILPFLVLIVFGIICSCAPDQIEDYHIVGIENYVDNPEDAVFSEITNDLEYLLTNFEYCDSVYHYFIKDSKVYSGITYGPGKYSLSILALTYDKDIYFQVKKYLMENHEYSTEVPQHTINGYDFYEEALPYWSSSFRFMFHTFNDDRNIVVLFNYATGYPYAEDFVKERESDFAGMLEKYFGEYYSFNE